MREEIAIKAIEIKKRLDDAREELDDIEGLLTFSDKKILTLQVKIDAMCVEDTRKTYINLEKELHEVIDLVRNIRQKKIEDIEDELSDLK